MSRRDNTTLEAAGAELLVIGHLLINRIEAFRAHTNQMGYDIIAIEPKTGKSARIQVKSRVAQDSGPFRVSNRDFDFLVLVRLNLSTKQNRAEGIYDSDMEPMFYIVPVEDTAVSAKRIRHYGLDQFLDRWDLIKERIEAEPIVGNSTTSG